jgi:RNA polymerase sigma-70 factor, ECF subfamily
VSETPLLSIEQLLLSARDGSPQALSNLLEACRDYLLAIANSEMEPWLQGKVGASDLVQDTFVAACNKFGNFRGKTEAEFLGWLRAILLNEKSTTIRSYRFTEKRRVDREVPLNGLSKTASNHRNPLSELLRDENVDRLRHSIAKLNDDYRMAIELRSIEQLSFVEVGQRIGRSEEASRKLWGRAILVLSELLENADDSA